MLPLAAPVTITTTKASLMQGLITYLNRIPFAPAPAHSIILVVSRECTCIFSAEADLDTAARDARSTDISVDLRI